MEPKNGGADFWLASLFLHSYIQMSFSETQPGKQTLSHQLLIRLTTAKNMYVYYRVYQPCAFMEKLLFSVILFVRYIKSKFMVDIYARSK